MITDVPNSFDDLAELVEEEGAIATIRMETLRIINGSERLGSTVVDKISEELDDASLGHYPETLPTNKNKIVLVFAKSTNLAKLLRILNDIQEDSDEEIHHITDDDAKKRIAQIRKYLG
jgi:capsular polysaccharide biosynthesis protein